MAYAFLAGAALLAIWGALPAEVRDRLWDELVELPGLIAILAAWAFVLTLNYGIAVIIFRYAFGVRMWNPFG